MVIGFLLVALFFWFLWAMVIVPVLQAKTNKEMKEQYQRWKEKQEQERLRQTPQANNRQLNKPIELTPTQKERLNYQEQILDCLAAFYKDCNGMTCTQIQKSIPDFEAFSNNKVAALLDSLTRAGKIIKHADKGKSLFKLSNNSLEEIARRKMRFEQHKIEFENQRREQEEKERHEREKQKKIMESGISAVDKMEGHQFEHYCANLLRKLNFSNVDVTKGSGDQGVDIIAVKDGIRYAIQCKCYSSPLGNSPVQEVNAGKQMYHCHVAVVLTNQHFTSGAKELAEATGVLLWGREKLQEMINQARQSQG